MMLEQYFSRSGPPTGNLACGTCPRINIFADGDCLRHSLRFVLLQVVPVEPVMLGHRDEAFLHFFGRDAWKTPDHAHHRDVDLGKMSVAIRAIVTMPMSTIRMAATVKVYGRLRAKRTIHTAVC
jgi:hypothetical protein